LKEGARVLDVGSGSGYLTVCFAHFVAPGGKVVGLDHIEGLVKDSIENTKKSNAALMHAGLLNYVVGDGRLGYPAAAPYDVIHVGAASDSIPQALTNQLAPGGILIIPVGTTSQSMKIIRKDKDGKLAEESSFEVRYVPLTDKDIQLNT
jgi:protein-L-isoaspartate(D-aspartate) O-methyltransferase